MYVDNAAMQLVKAPKAFDVVVTGNMFRRHPLPTKPPCSPGSIGMLPSASLNSTKARGLYEPSHGSAPTSRAKAWPTRWPPSCGRHDAALQPEPGKPPPSASKPLCKRCWRKGLRTPDIYSEGTTKVGTAQMGDAVVKALA